MTELGRKIIAPTSENEDDIAKIESALKPSLFKEFFEFYDGKSIPQENILKNIIETRFNVPRDRVEDAINLLNTNAKFIGILKHDNASKQDIISLKISSIGSNKKPRKSGVVQYDSKEKTKTDVTNTVFFITPIGGEDTEERKHSDMMIKHLITSTVKELDLKVVRADQIEKSGLITQQIFEYLFKSRICIADLSFNNPNVFYELGIRHMTKLPTIQIIRKGDKIPFDVSQTRTIIIDTSDVYTIMDMIEAAKKALSEHLKKIITSDVKNNEDNPIDVYAPGLKVSLPT